MIYEKWKEKKSQLCLFAQFSCSLLLHPLWITMLAYLISHAVSKKRAVRGTGPPAQMVAQPVFSCLLWKHRKGADLFCFCCPSPFSSMSSICLECYFAFTLIQENKQALEEAYILKSLCLHSAAFWPATEFNGRAQAGGLCIGFLSNYTLWQNRQQLVVRGMNLKWM